MQFLHFSYDDNWNNWVISALYSIGICFVVRGSIKAFLYLQILQNRYHNSQIKLYMGWPGIPINYGASGVKYSRSREGSSWYTSLECVVLSATNQLTKDASSEFNLQRPRLLWLSGECPQAIWVDIWLSKLLIIDCKLSLLQLMHLFQKPTTGAIQSNITPSSQLCN